MSFESADELDEFFDTDDFATRGVITSDAFTKTLNVIFDADTEEVSPFPETDIVAVKPSFICKNVDLADVEPGMTFTMPDLEAHEDGYGKTYKLTPRIVSEGGPQTSRVYLKEA